MRKILISAILLLVVIGIIFLIWRYKEYGISVTRSNNRQGFPGVFNATSGPGGFVAQKTKDTAKNAEDTAKGAISRIGEFLRKEKDNIVQKTKNTLGEAYDSAADAGKDYLGLSQSTSVGGPTGGVSVTQGNESISTGSGTDGSGGAYLAPIPHGSSAPIAQVLKVNEKIGFAPTRYLFRTLGAGNILCFVQWGDERKASSSCSLGKECFSHAYAATGEYYLQFSCRGASSSIEYNTGIVVSN